MNCRNASANLRAPSTVSPMSFSFRLLLATTVVSGFIKSDAIKLSSERAKPATLSVHEWIASAWLLTPSKPNTPHAHPASIAVDPQIIRPLAMPIDCTINGTESWPVHHTIPPKAASGSIERAAGRINAMTMPTNQMPAHSMNWKNSPSPTS